MGWFKVLSCRIIFGICRCLLFSIYNFQQIFLFFDGLMIFLCHFDAKFFRFSFYSLKYAYSMTLPCSFSLHQPSQISLQNSKISCWYDQFFIPYILPFFDLLWSSFSHNLSPFCCIFVELSLCITNDFSLEHFLKPNTSELGLLVF